MSRVEDYIDDYDMEPDDDDLEIPDVPWAEDIKKIEDHDLRETEIKKAEKIQKEAKELNGRLDRGEIGFDRYETIRQCTVLPKMRQATTRCGLASVGLTYDDLGDITEDAEYLHKEDTRLSDLKDQIKHKISNIGSDEAQELADHMREDEELSRDGYDRISRQIRLNRRQKK